MKLAFSVPLLLVAACGGSGLGVVGHKDQGGTTPNDLTVDSTPGDMAVPPEGDGGRTWTDESYTGYLDGGSLNGVWNSGSGTVIAVGDYGKILRSQEGGTFTQDPSSEPTMLTALTAIYGVPGPDLFTVGYGAALWKWGGGALTSTGTWNPDMPSTANDLECLWVPTDGVAFAGGEGVIIERIASSGNNWTTITSGTVPVTGESVQGIWAVLTGPSQYDVFAVGCATDSTTGYCTAPRIWHYANGTVTKETPPNATTFVGLWGVWGSGTTDVYAVGDTGTIIHSTGDGTWSKQATGLVGTDLPAFYAVSGSGPDEIYATGSIDGNGTAFFQKLDHTSSTWTRQTVGPANGRYFYSLSVTPTDVYMVGESGAILHK